MLNYENWYICLDDNMSDLELYYRASEQLPEIVGMIELFFNYRTVTGTLFFYPQEFAGYRCITVREFMEKHEAATVSWVITQFDKEAKHEAA